jgi:hypothetical protein
MPLTKKLKVGAAPALIVVVTLDAGGARQEPVLGFVWQMNTLRGSGFPPRVSGYRDGPTRPDVDRRHTEGDAPLSPWDDCGECRRCRGRKGDDVRRGRV